MAKDTIKVLDAVETRARTLKKFGNHIYLAGLGHGDEIHADHAGYIYPYLIVGFSSLDEGPPSAQGIVSSREDSKRMFVTFQIVASHYRTAMELAQDVRELFEGFEVEGCSQMIEVASSAMSVPNTETMRPKRFGQATIFSLVVD